MDSNLEIISVKTKNSSNIYVEKHYNQIKSIFVSRQRFTCMYSSDWQFVLEES